MEVKYNQFHDFQEDKPEEMRNCLVIWEGCSQRLNIMFGSYDAGRNIFADGLGGILEGIYVKCWAYDSEGILNLRNHDVE